MSEIYNYEYYHNYDSAAYEDQSHWLEFFENIADRIVEDFKPSTVLDAGCAMGYLVAALRDRGVEAYGLDISEYAISKVREDIKPYCVVSSLTEPLPEILPQRYDLAVTIEVLEHLYADEGKKAIENLCGLTDRIIFSSTPDDFSERTHVNVQQREYWAKLFAEQGFYDDINYRPTYLTYYASFFKRGEDTLRQIENYERNIRITENKIRIDALNYQKIIDNQSSIIEQSTKQRDKLTEQLKEMEAELDHHKKIYDEAISQQEKLKQEKIERERSFEEKLSEVKHEYSERIEKLEAELVKCQKIHDGTIEKLKQEKIEGERSFENLLSKARHECYEQIEEVKLELAHYKKHYEASINQREKLKQEKSELEQRLSEVNYAYSVISNAFCWKMTKPLRAFLDFIKTVPPFGLFIKGLKCLKKNGLRYTWKKVREKISTQEKDPYSKCVLRAQRREKFPLKIKFSVIVPLYNTPLNFLREMIESVQAQTYENWELCMAYGSDSEHTEVEKICKSFAKKDKRIQYKKLEKNLGISGNSNACLDMATGDYIALLDHDDVLHPAALYEIMHAICYKNADFIYTDECHFKEKLEDAYDFHFKPDFAPDNLRSINYICHFTAFKRKLLDEVGQFASSCDGSQDHDLFLRLTEKAENIVHIPKILYYWRASSGSTAESLDNKLYAIEAGVLSVEKQLDRLGLDGEVKPVRPGLSVYRINYMIKDAIKISILIPNYEHLEDLEKCLNSIFEKTTYLNYEIIIVENNSSSLEIFDFYKKIQQEHHNVQIVKRPGEFNYSAINNFGFTFCNGDYILLLNNDTEVITPNWLEEMLMFAQREDVGAVGAMLYYPDDTIQHAGVILGLGGVAGHAFRYFNKGECGYQARLLYAQNLSAVTGACMMIRRNVWEKVGGLDEAFAVAFNDVDFCMRIRQAGYLIVWTPFAELYHCESKSRGKDNKPEYGKKYERFVSEAHYFQERWKKELAAGDPYYNPNLTLEREDFSMKLCKTLSNIRLKQVS